MAQHSAGMFQDNHAIIHAGIRMSGRDFLSIHTFNLSGYPTCIIVIMDHQIHQDAARFGFVQEPVPYRFLGAETAPAQADDTWLADLSLGDRLLRQGIFRKEAHHVRDQ
jgi:hypothetical protein